MHTYKYTPRRHPHLPTQVIDQDSGAVFAGSSPTKPWTDVCVAHRTGQRISGPLFFGFSDPLTQRAIAANLYSQEELRAALQVGQRMSVCLRVPHLCVAMSGGGSVVVRRRWVAAGR